MEIEGLMSIAIKPPAIPNRTPPSEHFVTLDALRGVAALAVVLFHRRWWFDFPLLEHAYLAVDFFFMLSGFVIAFAYEKKLRDGAMTVPSFCRRRVIRLWPLIALGAVIGAVSLAFAPLQGEDAPTNTNILIGLIFALLLLPIPPLFATKPFQINEPSWSLFFELIANFVYAFVAPLLSTRRLIIGNALLLASIILITIFSGVDIRVGFQYQTLGLGIPRVLSPFFIGVLIYRLHAENKLPRIPLNGVFLSGILIALFLVPVGMRAIDLIFPIVCIGLVFPAIIVAGAQHEVSSKWMPVAALSGELSYPVYILHYPLLALGDAALSPLIASASLKFAILILLIMIVSFAASRFFDRPVRSWLARRYSKTKGVVKPT